MQQCPICFSDLEVTDCAPCDDCGHLPEEIEHFKSGIHRYTVYEIAHGLRLQLCNFCDVDFGSYKPDYLGLRKNKHLGFEHFNFVKAVENPILTKDYYCSSCGHRLTFLKFLCELREREK